MSIPHPDPAGPAIDCDMPWVPPDFEAFQARYDRAFLEYSRIHLADPAAARRLVDATFLYLAVIWPRLRVMADRGAYAWALFKQRVHGELDAQGRSPALTENLAFARAIRAATEPLLESFRTSFHAEHGDEFAELEEGLGIYRHMARLSERQFDVLVLRDALAFTTRDTALIMGISEATVRSTHRTAKIRMASAMGYRTDDAPEADKE